MDGEASIIIEAIDADQANGKWRVRFAIRVERQDIEVVLPVSEAECGERDLVEVAFAKLHRLSSVLRRADVEALAPSDDP